MPGDRLERVAKRRGVVVADRRDHRHEWVGQVRRVEATASAHLQHAKVDALPREVQQRERRADFKRGGLAQPWRKPVHGVADRLSQGDNGLGRDGPGVDARAFPPVDQVRRRITASAQPGGLHACADHGDRTALAFGARDEHAREACLGLSQRQEQRTHAVELGSALGGHLVLRPRTLREGPHPVENGPIARIGFGGIQW